MTEARLSWFALQWPRDVQTDRLLGAFRVLATSRATPIVLQATGTQNAVVHRIALPAAAAETLIEQLGGAIPGVGFARLRQRPAVAIDRAVAVSMTTAGRPLRSDDAESVSRALLTALSALRPGETVVLQWQLAVALAPSPVGNHTPPRRPAR